MDRRSFLLSFYTRGLRTQTTAAAHVYGPRSDYFVKYIRKNILLIFYSFVNDSVFIDSLACRCALTFNNTFARGGLFDATPAVWRGCDATVGPSVFCEMAILFRWCVPDEKEKKRKGYNFLTRGGDYFGKKFFLRWKNFFVWPIKFLKPFSISFYGNIIMLAYKKRAKQARHSFELNQYIEDYLDTSSLFQE